MVVTDVAVGETRAKTRHVAPLDITVLAGGPGGEREVSLDSGRAVYEALCRQGHNVFLSDVGPDDLRALGQPADCVFIALHGEFGEDGTIQAELEGCGLAYSGSGVAASRIAMDKPLAKQYFQRAGIPTPHYEVVTRDCLSGLASRFAVPAVVKPCASGSSVDTRIVRTGTDLCDAAADLVNRYGTALVETLITGPELTVAILGDRALPVCEIRTSREFYDYDAKYVDDDTQYLFDLDLPSAFLERVQKLSLAAHRAIGCEVFSRVDWMVDGATMEPYILEVNTIPGFTSHSLVPKSAARIGISFDRLCQQIVEQSLRVHRPGRSCSGDSPCLSGPS